jgi:hypothetical protein
VWRNGSLNSPRQTDQHTATTTTTAPPGTQPAGLPHTKPVLTTNDVTILKIDVG